MSVEPSNSDTEAAVNSGGIRRQYHPTQLAIKHGLSRADARKVIAAARGSREKADEIALTMAGKPTAYKVDEATHGSGIRNADHGTGSDKQKLPQGVKRRPTPATPEEEDAFGLPRSDKRAGHRAG